MKIISLLLTSTLLLLSFQGCGNDSKEQDAKVVVSGIEKENMDLSVRSQDDFYHHVNGLWIQKTEIPDDAPLEDSFSEIRNRVNKSLKEIIVDAAQNSSASSKEKLIGDFYTSYMDIASINAKGNTPLQESLKIISQASTHDDIIKLFADLRAKGVATPLNYYIGSDQKNSKHYITYFAQAGVTLPSKIYYFSQEARYITAREKYKTYIASLMDLAGYTNTQIMATNILKLETILAEIHVDENSQDISGNMYNKYTKNEAKTLFGSFDFEAFLNHSELDISEMIIKQPFFFKEFAKVFEQTPLSVWKEYLAYKYVDEYSSYLSDDFVALRFDFFSKTLNGIKAPPAREKKAINATSEYFGDIVGELYVKKHSSAQTKAKAHEMTQNIFDIFRTSIAELDWMSPPTKEAALVKLNKITIKIAYPDTWKDYSNIDIKPDDLVGNMQRFIKWFMQIQKSKLGTLIDNKEWDVTPQTANAFYNPTANSIVIPAAILQAPFFYPSADDAVNYGAIGSVIGHELTHAFDNRGSQYDEDGNLRDWWAESDKKEFAKLTQKLVEQFSAYEPIEGDSICVDGELTLGENIADLGGINMAYKAYIKSLNAKKSPIIDGYTGEQRFFIGYAQIWRNKTREEFLRNLLLNDSHSPGIYRTNGVITNFSDFYKAFEVKVGDKLYKPEQERIKIW